jgi:hypothetical protein
MLNVTFHVLVLEAHGSANRDYKWANISVTRLEILAYIVLMVEIGCC